jgi:hypothetical protein
VRTIIAGRVTPDTLAAAQMFGIEPTGFVTNGLSVPPVSNLSTDVHPICKALGVFGREARDYTLCQRADALILVGRDDHLLRVANQYGLTLYQEG